ncbi:FecR domain-containing protein, partial [Flavihumibacter sediminis]|nr:FecR domain-containing protein [Flavihumibacter sediminis]
TKVWLNAATSLQFPASFNGKERRVKLTGEAYFEVAQNAAQPFIVETPYQTVEVLGTHFNVNAYKDEALSRTTLLEGKVKVQSGTSSQVIKPGQQAACIQAGSIQINE